MNRTRKAVGVYMSLLTLVMLAGCTTTNDSDYECEWISQIQPVFNGKTWSYYPYTQCFPVPKEKKTK